MFCKLTHTVNCQIIVGFFNCFPIRYKILFIKNRSSNFSTYEEVKFYYDKVPQKSRRHTPGRMWFLHICAETYKKIRFTLRYLFPIFLYLHIESRSYCISLQFSQVFSVGAERISASRTVNLWCSLPPRYAKFAELILHLLKIQIYERNAKNIHCVYVHETKTIRCPAFNYLFKNMRCFEVAPGSSENFPFSSLQKSGIDLRKQRIFHLRRFGARCQIA